MKKVGFIGAFDKSNLIMYVAKTLTWVEKKVLVVDTTLLQKTKYIIPSMSPTKSYITDFENIDFAIGFNSMVEIERYLEVPEEKLPYDYILIDIDSSEAIDQFDMQEAQNNYFVTAFDMFSLRKGLAIFDNLAEPLKLTRVLYRYDLEKEDEDYLNYLSMEYKVTWNDFLIYLPNLDEDTQAIEENQRVQRIRIKRLCADYQDGLIFIAQDILNEKNAGMIKRSIKE